MNPIPIGLIDDDPHAHDLFVRVMDGLKGRCEGQPIACATGLSERISSGLARWQRARDGLAAHGGPLVLFLDFDLGLSDADRAEVRTAIASVLSPVEREQMKLTLAGGHADGVALAMYALKNPAISPLLLVHNSRGHDGYVLDELIEFGSRCGRLQTEFAFTRRPIGLGIKAFSEADAGQVHKFISWAVREFTHCFPVADPLDTTGIVAAWRDIKNEINGPGWFGRSDGTDPLFATKLPLVGPPGPNTTHEFQAWSEAEFAALASERATNAVGRILSEIDPSAPLSVPTASMLDGFWPISCLKAMDHQLLHRALLLRAVGMPFAGLLDGVAAHRREICLGNTGADRLFASARVLAALRSLRGDFKPVPPVAFRIRERNRDRNILRFQFKVIPKKMEEVIMAVTLWTSAERRESGHSTGGTLTRCCEWLGQHAANLWLSRARDNGDRLELTLAVDFEEGELP